MLVQAPLRLRDASLLAFDTLLLVSHAGLIAIPPYRSLNAPKLTVLRGACTVHME
jgi:hypothetical protein